MHKHGSIERSGDRQGDPYEGLDGPGSVGTFDGPPPGFDQVPAAERALDDDLASADCAHAGGCSPAGGGREPVGTRLHFEVDGGPGRGQFHHKRILAAIEQRDADAAREAMRAHLEQVREDSSASLTASSQSKAIS